MLVAWAEAEVSGLSGHRERLSEVLRAEVWWPGPWEDRGSIELVCWGEESTSAVLWDEWSLLNPEHLCLLIKGNVCLWVHYYIRHIVSITTLKITVNDDQVTAAWAEIVILEILLIFSSGFMLSYVCTFVHAFLSLYIVRSHCPL